MSLKSRLSSSVPSNRNQQRSEFIDWSTRIIQDMKNGTFNKLDIRHLIGELSDQIESGKITLRQGEDVLLERINQ